MDASLTNPFLSCNQDKIRTLESDKHYWHRYTAEYERLIFSKLRPRRIVEFGVLEGSSIVALSDRFPAAEIIGIDILPVQSGWPQSDRIRYLQVDQAERESIAAIFRRVGACDLVIEDGSHIPQHQATCLVESWPHITSGGWYIVEDIHTSHPNNPDWNRYTPTGQANALHVLLAIDHLKATGRDLTKGTADSLTGFFTTSEILGLHKTLSQMHVYRRGLLPLRCYRCHQSDFDYVALRCRCGVELYGEADSMTCLLQKV